MKIHKINLVEPEDGDFQRLYEALMTKEPNLEFNKAVMDNPEATKQVLKQVYGK